MKLCKNKKIVALSLIWHKKKTMHLGPIFVRGKFKFFVGYLHKQIL